MQTANETVYEHQKAAADCTLNGVECPRDDSYYYGFRPYNCNACCSTKFSSTTNSVRFRGEVTTQHCRCLTSSASDEEAINAVNWDTNKALGLYCCVEGKASDRKCACGKAGENISSERAVELTSPGVEADGCCSGWAKPVKLKNDYRTNLVQCCAAVGEEVEDGKLCYPNRYAT